TPVGLLESISLFSLRALPPRYAVTLLCGELFMPPAPSVSAVPDARGRFGPYGGRFVPETLMFALEQLDSAYRQAKTDPAFQAEFHRLLNEYVGRPSRLYFAERLTKEAGGARIYLKREDLNHTGAHKINNALGQ